MVNTPSKRLSYENRRILKSTDAIKVRLVGGGAYKCPLQEEHPRCYQAKGSKVEEKLVHLTMVVKFVVLIEKKKMCSLGLMMFDWWMEFWMVHLEELEMKKFCRRRCGLEEEALVEFMVEWFEEDEDGKKNRKEGLFNLKA
ncbi:hypothetical protein Tco_0863137 [Tanacetum coccineum]